MNPLILNKHRDQNIPLDAVYIGRGSIWGNPFPITKDSPRAKVIAEHRTWLMNQYQSGRITIEQLASLHGKHLVCFCAPAACHGETLIEAAAWAVGAADPTPQTKERSMDEFKLIVAGGRSFNDYEKLCQELFALANGPYALHDVSIVSGMAPGADRLAVQFAKQFYVVLHEMPADWKHYGRSAGMRRNADMAAFADGALCFWNGVSKGTKNMIETMKRLNKPVHVVMYDEPEAQVHRGFHQANGRFIKGL